MRNPEIIKEEISKLNKELGESIKYYEFTPLFKGVAWKNVGSFYPDKLKAILSYLSIGYTLKFAHEIYNNPVYITMNSQKNRILVTEHSYFTESNIVNYMLNGSGEWFINNQTSKDEMNNYIIDGICFICKKPTENLSPNKNRWRIDLPFNNGNGLQRPYHTGCLAEFVDKNLKVIK